MSSIVELPTPQRQPTAELWVARLDRGLSSEEEHKLKAWLAAEPGNVQALLSMAEVWAKMDSLSRLASLFPEHRPRTERKRSYMVAVAASLLVCAGVAILLTMRGDRPDSMQTQQAASWYASYETAVGQKSSITLPDGSELMLNTNTKVGARYSATHRLLVLERGEIFVRVAKEAGRPLSVHAAERIIQAVGTEFSIQITDAQRIELVVTEGKVKVGIRNPTLSASRSEESDALPLAAPTVGANEAVILGDDEEAVTELTAKDVEVKLSWLHGNNLIFRGESLQQAVNEISRYTSIEFVFLDENLKKVRVAGLFKADDVEGLLSTLQENFDIVYRQVSERTILLDSKAGPSTTCEVN